MFEQYDIMNLQQVIKNIIMAGKMKKPHSGSGQSLKHDVDKRPSKNKAFAFFIVNSILDKYHNVTVASQYVWNKLYLYRAEASQKEVRKCREVSEYFVNVLLPACGSDNVGNAEAKLSIKDDAKTGIQYLTLEGCHSLVLIYGVYFSIYEQEIKYAFIDRNEINKRIWHRYNTDEYWKLKKSRENGKRYLPGADVWRLDWEHRT